MFEFQHGFLMVVQEFQSKSLNHQESLALVGEEPWKKSRVKSRQEALSCFWCRGQIKRSPWRYREEDMSSSALLYHTGE